MEGKWKVYPTNYPEVNLKRSRINFERNLTSTQYNRYMREEMYNNFLERKGNGMVEVKLHLQALTQMMGILNKKK